MSNKEWRKYDVPFIGSDELPPEDDDLIVDNNSLINISLTKSEWLHVYHQLSWEFQINGYVDEKLDKILNEFKKQLLIMD